MLIATQVTANQANPKLSTDPEIEEDKTAENRMDRIASH